ncbi:MAG: hypothetical protein UX13_C0052G0005 [Candidatus Woesebacteria bacterium GW2011_GWB1_45_5]|uniref:Glycosyl transferase family 2 n=1 Tax=Candidatus Woesebacteria bacterium GW2011_GWB1_45_5 TaxID=1618581 RepID=A0A0G1PU37_9BACT|nr:MAG: hypothetical protein UX13_C0052G0005 [Candidatus Woesebacteria bacterium GW2011_GWB1_45_5]
MKNVEVITLSRKNLTDFASARNGALKKSKKEWALFLDSDEKISPAEIDPVLLDDEFSGYYLKRKNYFLGQYVGSDRIIRLGKRNSGEWARRVHEVWKIKGKVGRINSPVIIHNTAESLSDYIKKINFYSTLHAKANGEEDKTPSLLKIILYPGLKFFETYLKSRHPVFSIMQAFHSFLAWSKLYFLRS